MPEALSLIEGWKEIAEQVGRALGLPRSVDWCQKRARPEHGERRLPVKWLGGRATLSPADLAIWVAAGALDAARSSPPIAV